MLKEFHDYFSPYCSAAATTGTATRCRLGGVRRLIDTYPKSQFGPLRVTPRERHFTIDQNQRQRILAGALQERFYGSVVRKGLWLLRQIEALDLRPVLLRPISIGSKIDEGLVNINPTHTRATAQRRVKDFDLLHLKPPSSIEMYVK
jgi:hypothetical protein